MINKIIYVALLSLICSVVSCKKQSANPPKNSVAANSDSLINLDTTSLAGFHRWFGSVQSNNGSAIPLSVTGNCYMQFNIAVVNDTTVIANRDTLTLSRIENIKDTLKFYHYYYPNPYPHFDNPASPVKLQYDIKRRKIIYLEDHPTQYLGNFSWNLSVIDTTAVIPISLLGTYIPRMRGVRQWHVHRSGGLNEPDTTVSFALSVINDSTIKTKSFWIMDSNASLAGVPDNEVLYYTSYDAIDQTISFRSNYYPVRGGCLTYYYANDSMVYEYGRRDNDPAYSFYLHTQ